LGQLLGRAVGVVGLEDEWIGERRRQYRVLGLTGNLSQRVYRIVMRALAASVGRKIELAEAHAARHGELIAVLLIPGLEFGCRGLVSGGHILGQELHFLRHTAPYN